MEKKGKKFLLGLTNTSKPASSNALQNSLRIVAVGEAKNTHLLKLPKELLCKPVCTKYLVLPKKNVLPSKKRSGRPPFKRSFTNTSKQQKGYFPHLNWLDSSDSSEDGTGGNGEGSGEKALEERHHVLDLDDDDNEDEDEIESATIVPGDVEFLGRLDKTQDDDSGEEDQEQLQDEEKEN